MRLIDADKTIEMIGNLQCSNMEQRDTICYVMEEIEYADTELTVEAIPVEWVIAWLTRQHIPATHTCDDYYAVEMMLDDWENNKWPQ